VTFGSPATVGCWHSVVNAVKSKTKRAPAVSRAAEVRQIAMGIFDKKERRAVLKLVAEYLKLSKKAGPPQP